MINACPIVSWVIYNKPIAPRIGTSILCYYNNYDAYIERFQGAKQKRNANNKKLKNIYSQNHENNNNLNDTKKKIFVLAQDLQKKMNEFDGDDFMECQKIQNEVKMVTTLTAID